MKKVSLKTIADALEWVDDETSVYYDTVTGETEVWSEYGDNDIDADELDERLEAGRYIALPDRMEINEYHMMEVFAYDRDKRLVNALNGRGAFRRFKDTAENIGLLDDWYEFRENCYKSRAEDWCNAHDLEWE